MSSIRISDKWGVNPGAYSCFWCGEVVGVAMYGRLKNDAEAPQTAVLNYDPCDDCKQGMSLGITFVEAVASQPDDGRPPLQRKPQPAWPTGRWCVIQEDAVKELIADKALLAHVLKHRRALLEHDMWKALGLPEESVDNREEAE